MQSQAPYLVLAYYKFVEVADPHLEMRSHKKFFQNRDVTGRIYLSQQGVNGQLSGARKDMEAYMDWLHEIPCFADVYFKIHESHENVFPRITVKVREQLVAMDEEVDLSLQGEHVSPRKWKEMIEAEDDHIIIDVRNDYEWEIGHFEGAKLPKLSTFRKFPQYARDLKKEIDPKKTKVMMYCTGGIRCELYSALMKEEGFDKVYQLDGGVINYGLKEGNEHWDGKLFVFDERMAVPLSNDPHSVIGKCHYCETECDTQYNCANMDCNDLFVCCLECLKKHNGCCKEACIQAPRVRKCEEREGSKPFRRLHHYRQKGKQGLHASCE